MAILSSMLQLWYWALLLVLHCLISVLRHVKKLILFLNPGRLSTNKTGVRELEEDPKSVVPTEAHEDYAQFLALCKMPDKSNLIFVSLALHSSTQKVSGIAGIGLCTWSPSRSTLRMRPRFWSITDTVHSGQARRQGSLFQDYSEISESEIKLALDDALGPMIARYQTIVLVGHHIGSTLVALNRFWLPPSQSILILDTCLIWQYHFESSAQVSLQTALLATPGISYDPHQFDVEGNEARYTIDLLKALGKLALKRYK
ncbi:hypothetical protein F4861DRAFT_379454 [Xylaria intraflava]|nr:hypothetical protein F4861DRAFT_379454 [Xylaria intraflava]